MNATGDQRYPDAAVEGAANLAATLSDVSSGGLYTGLALLQLERAFGHRGARPAERGSAGPRVLLPDNPW